MDALTPTQAEIDRDEAMFLSLLESEDWERAENDLNHFVVATFPILEPGREYKPNWHIDAIVEHLEAVSAGDIQKLLINVPYRAMKSRLVSCFWPAWDWISSPERRFLYVSHREGLALRDAVHSRRLLASDWYRRGFGDRFKLAWDQQTKGRFENDHFGYRISIGFKSGAAGEGGDFIVADDPHNIVEGMFSDKQRESVIEIWDQQLQTRRNDPEKSALVVVMQRLHQMDLTGHLLEEGDWTHLMLPMEFEPERKCFTSLGFSDPRTEAGEKLWPNRFDDKYIKQQKKRLGTYGASGQLQQRPSPLKGGIVDLDWFKRYKTPPSDDDCFQIVQSWDTGNKDDELINDPSVCGTWGETDDGWFLLHVFRKHLQFPALLTQARRLADSRDPDAILIEDAASGTQLIQTLRRDKKKRPILPISVNRQGSKIVRMSVTSPFIEAGNIWLPESAEWLQDYEDEMSNFPNAAHDDQVDMTSQFLRWITKPKSRPRVRQL